VSAEPAPAPRKAPWFRRPGRSLTRRLIWLASAWILLALVITGYVLTAQFREAGLRRLGNVLSDTIDEVVVATISTQTGQLTVAEIKDARTLRLLSGKYWQIAEPVAGGGMRVLARSPSLDREELMIPGDLPPKLQEAFGQTITYNAGGPNGEPLRVAASMKQLPGRPRPVVFMAGIDRTNIENDTRQFATVTWLALLLLGGGLVSAVFIQVQIGLRPLYKLRTEIAAVRRGKAARIERDYPVEIQPLAEQVNRLLDHNQEVVERQRTHVGNLAHALKTPLSVLIAEAGSVEGPLQDVVRRQAALMQAQVDHHLRRARAAARVAHGLGERTPVGEVLDELAVTLERVFGSKGIEIDWRAPDDLAFLGERQDLQEIVGNLMENACKWAKRRVRATAAPEPNGRLSLVVEDDGAGLPEARRAEVLKRGARLDEGAPGSGLGLAIVEDLTRAYGGTLALSDSGMGGLRAAVTLPAAGD
jgi:signal transduction histidine kinase